MDRHLVCLRCQLHADLDDCKFGMMQKHTLAIGKHQFLPAKPPHVVGFAVIDVRIGDDTAHLPAVRPRVHANRPAETSRNSVAKFHPGQAIFRGKYGKSRQRFSARGNQRCSLGSSPAHTVGTNYHAPVSLIGKQDVTAASEQKHRTFRVLRLPESPDQLLLCAWFGKQVRRAADVKRRIWCQQNRGTVWNSQCAQAFSHHFFRVVALRFHPSDPSPAFSAVYKSISNNSPRCSMV